MGSPALGIRRREERGRFILVLLVAGAAALSAQAPDRRTWNQAYRDGHRELRAGRYQEAERSFKRSAEADFAPTRRLADQQIEGTERDKFYPEYFRALAILNQKGREVDALALLERVKNEGLVPKGSAEAKALDGYVLQARNAIPPPVVASNAPPPTDPPPTRPTTTPPSTTTAVPSAPPPTKPPAAPPSTTTAVSSAPPPAKPATTSTIGPSTTTVSSAPPPIAPIPLEVIASADRAIQAAKEAQGRVGAIRDLDVLRALDSDLRQLDATAAANLDAAVAKLAGGRPGSAADAESARSLAQESARAFLRAQQRADAIVKQSTDALVSATRPYFAGRYAEAKTRLERLYHPGGRFALQWRLFRSASAYALYVLGRQQDDKLRLEAATNIRELRRLAPPDFKPDAAAFSPAFVRFFATVQ